MMHFLITIFFALAIIGVLLWGINKIGAPPVVVTVVTVVVAVVLLLWLWNQFDAGAFNFDMPRR